VQKRVVELATEYGGILSPLHLVKDDDLTWKWHLENKDGTKEAIEVLERFTRHGLAVKIEKPLIGRFYYFPMVLAHMTETERKIIEMLMDEPDGLTIPQMIYMTALSIESLKHTLERLIADGVVVARPLEEKYVLRGFSMLREFTSPPPNQSSGLLVDRATWRRRRPRNFGPSSRLY
jgi:hypothetical protein